MRLGFTQTLCYFLLFFGVYMQTITSKNNSVVKLVQKLNSSAKTRKKELMFVVEGLRLVNDAMASNATFECFMCSESFMEKNHKFINDIDDITCKKYVLTDKLFSEITDTETPQGVLAIVKFLDKMIAFDKIISSGKFLALENIQDPGNLGTIFRTCEAMGINGIIMTHNCCDVYSPKVVRSTMGSVFRLPFYFVENICEFLDLHKELTSYASVVHGNSVSIKDVEFVTPCVMVIGNEGNGIINSTMDRCNFKVTIPMMGRNESLNASVAASVLMWEMMK